MRRDCPSGYIVTGNKPSFPERIVQRDANCDNGFNLFYGALPQNPVPLVGELLDQITRDLIDVCTFNPGIDFNV